MRKANEDTRGTSGQLPLSDYRPQPEWLREATEGPFPRDENGNPQQFNVETGEWEAMKPP